MTCERCPNCGGGSLVFLSHATRAAGGDRHHPCSDRWWCFACAYMEIMPGPDDFGWTCRDVTPLCRMEGQDAIEGHAAAL